MEARGECTCSKCSGSMTVIVAVERPVGLEIREATLPPLRSQQSSSMNFRIRP